MIRILNLYRFEETKSFIGFLHLILKFVITTIFVFSLCYLLFGNATAAEVSENLLKAISKVESRDNNLAVGDKGKALGRYQLWESYVKDANKVGHYNFTHNDAKDASKAKRMVIAYLTHYGNRYERMTGKKATDEILSRIHNGGPNGWNKLATVKYWNKIKKELGK